MARPAANEVATGTGKRMLRWGSKRRVQAANRQTPPSASAEVMLDETGGTVPVPTAMLPVKRATVCATRTVSHCSNSSGERIACPDLAVKSTSTCCATRAAS
ncbi:MAG TPA: hypothetical protein VNH82_09070 [Candidatus Dormibacteraeota bacterium]|nr:hypothetical protein [Candidatus Dormibacteraeota bacterium]